MPIPASSTASTQRRARWLRLDTAHLLKTFFFCERALLISAAAWIPHVASLGIKTGLARCIWQSAETAHALRNRVFELRFPSRIFEPEEADRSLAAVFGAVRESPSPPAFLCSAGRVLLPRLRDAYRAYLDASDPIADGPTHRFLVLALEEKAEQIAAFETWARDELTQNPHLETEALGWTKTIATSLKGTGGVGIELPARTAAVSVPGGKPNLAPARPARDQRFWPCRFYWPDIVDPSYPYGEGLRLQLRSAISHLNEVWAIEAAAIMLGAFADVLPWEWIHDSARWTYDESRHCRMGYERLMAWGFEPPDIPLGTYIYDSASGQDPIYRLGMLYFFETKNIKHKLARAQSFHDCGDRLSEHDMDFDWADETIHASYGKHWLTELLTIRGHDPAAYQEIRERCGKLVADCIATATPSEAADIKAIANAMITKASGRSGV